MAKIALSGYGTLDFVALGTSKIHPDATNLMTVSDGGWPRAGGAALFAGAALASAGHDASPVLMIGNDAAGEILQDQAKSAGLSLGGISRQTGARTPVCVLIHQPHGGYCCFLDTGGMGETALTDGQNATLDEADWIVVAAAPARQTCAVLDRLQPHQKLAWIVKADDEAFPDVLRDRLNARADVIFCNKHERQFLGRCLSRPASDQALFVTEGEHGVSIFHCDMRIHVPAIQITIADATGAGDTFAGGALAVLVNDALVHENVLEVAACAGIKTSRTLLEHRLPRPYQTSTMPFAE